MRLNDAVIGVALILFALAMIWLHAHLPRDAGPGLRPGPVPGADRRRLHRAPASILIVSGLRRRRVRAPVRRRAWLRSGPHIINFLAVVGGLLLYILASDWLGFILTSLLLLFGWLAPFRRGKPISSLVIALAVTLAVDYAFSQLLLVPLPLGLLQPLLDPPL